MPCREKFQNYLGDLGKHGKQLQEKNDQLLEELQGLSKRCLVSKWEYSQFLQVYYSQGIKYQLMANTSLWDWAEIVVIVSNLLSSWMCHNGMSASRIFGLNNKDVLEKIVKNDTTSSICLLLNIFSQGPTCLKVLCVQNCNLNYEIL